ncbi:MAG: metallopeptidase TldD-related protein [Planctomycetota bacterium]|jgi:hypothetical protein
MKNIVSHLQTLTAAAALLATAAASARPGDDRVMDALVDELDRSMSVQLEDLQAPYFVQYAVTDSAAHRISATCGAVVGSDDSRSRRLATSVRVGYYDLDNTNFAGGGGRGFGRRGRRPGGGGRGFGGMAALPTEDSYEAIRQATWLATDAAYKSAVETLARKQAYLEDRAIEDRPADFARVDPVVAIDEKVGLELDVVAWEDRLRRLSARFLRHRHVLDAQVTLTASADNRYLVNSEGARIRRGVTGVVLAITATGQAEDGEELADRMTHHAPTAAELPDERTLAADVDAMAARLGGRVTAPVMEDYLGPVLFDGRAAPQLFRAMLARGVAGTPDPVGGGRRRFAGTQSLDKYLGKRVLPRGFNVYDDPRQTALGDRHLAGHYTIDDEGVAPERVNIVVDGRMQGMVMSRTPTRDFAESSGHGRTAGAGRTRAAVGCLFIEAENGVSAGALKDALIEAVRDQGLEYGVRVESIGGAGGSAAAQRAALLARFGGGGGGGGSGVGDPVAVYRVYPDGHEELVRGCEFGTLDVGTLRDIIAAGQEPIVHNTGSATGAAASVVAPAVLFEEVELFTIEDEPARLPIVTAPHARPRDDG